MSLLPKIEILNLRYEKPSKPYDFNIDRRTGVGNPFRIDEESDRDLVCDQYEEWFLKSAHLDKFYRYLDRMEAMLKKYNKIRLFCWCPPKRCHGETIKKYLLKQL